MKRRYIQPQTVSICLHSVAPLMEGSMGVYDDTVGHGGLVREEMFDSSEDW